VSTPPLARPKLWDVERVATELNVSKATVYRLVADKRIPFIRLGQLLRFEPESVRTWLDERTVPAVGK
jgi:excisionase family DNA binding protein